MPHLIETGVRLHARAPGFTLKSPRRTGVSSWLLDLGFLLLRWSIAVRRPLGEGWGIARRRLPQFLQRAAITHWMRTRRLSVRVTAHN